MPMAQVPCLHRSISMRIPVHNIRLSDFPSFFVTSQLRAFVLGSLSGGMNVMSKSGDIVIKRGEARVPE